jgi:hypothetical protein
MKKLFVVFLSVVFFTGMVGPTYVQALDLSIPDALHGTQVAATGDYTPLQTKLSGFEDHLVKWSDFNMVTAQERKKTNNTIAVVIMGILTLLALNHGNNGRDGKDGVDGKDGNDGGCRR